MAIRNELFSNNNNNSNNNKNNELISAYPFYMILALKYKKEILYHKILQNN